MKRCRRQWWNVREVAQNYYGDWFACVTLTRPADGFGAWWVGLGVPLDEVRL